MRSGPGRVTLAVAALVVACRPGPERPAGERPAAPPGSASKAAAEILSCFELPRSDARSHNLSGLAWDGARNLLYALSDREPQITVLAPRPGFASYELRPSIALDIDLGPGAWDGEALAIAGDRFLLVADETHQVVVSVDRSGQGAARVALPPFPGTRDNRGLEGLGYIESGEGRYLFAVNEQALEGDGPTSTAANGTLVRILRHPLDGGEDLQVAYLTDPVFARGAGGENGVSDLAVLSRDRVLVMERAYVPGVGNAIRIYRVELGGAEDVGALADARAAAPVAKRLVLDLSLLPGGTCSGVPLPGRRRWLENYEGLATGPIEGDGRRVIFLVSDDNSSAGQRARLLAIAIAPGALE